MHRRVLLTENYTVCMFEDARPDGARINAFPNKPVSKHTSYTPLGLKQLKKQAGDADAFSRTRPYRKYNTICSVAHPVRTMKRCLQKEVN